ncbi:MAG: hypothetical protein WCF23_03855 [Candidatus Nitrosopolaris sp.]
MKDLDEDSLKEIQNAPTDEFGVLHLNILYNPEVDRCFCGGSFFSEPHLWKQFRNIKKKLVSSAIGSQK